VTDETLPGIVDAAEARAGGLLRAALATTTPGERRRATRLGRLLADPAGRELLFTLTDEILRTPDDARAARRLAALVAPGLPRSLGPVDRAGLRLAAAAGRVAPGTTARVVRARLKLETRGVILPASDPAFGAHIARRAAEGVACNVNQLGEAILGDDEADARLAAVGALLRRTDVPCVSVKVSAICANLTRRSTASSSVSAHCSRSRPPRSRRRSSTSTWRSTATSSSRCTRSGTRSTSPSSAS
jgi:RHH-type proline utilization regulon transcriptional repressor/proline dehydrogenase/delta 1-pyrroline-5-carboxylate dehydrogenase